MISPKRVRVILCSLPKMKLTMETVQKSFAFKVKKKIKQVQSLLRTHLFM